MTNYSLTKAGKEWKGRGTHLTAVLEALKKLGGKAAGAEIAAYVEKHGLLKSTKMDQREACSWILSHAVRIGILRRVK